MESLDFQEVVVARRAAWLRVAWLLCGDAATAEDLVQTALERTARHWGRITRSGDPEAYVRRAIYSAHVSRWRWHRSRPPESALPGDDASLPARRGPEDDVTTRVTLRAALDRLTPKQRAVLVLRYYEDLTEPQVAQVLGVGVGTVKSQARHALRRLRELAPELADLDPQPDLTGGGRS
ncbi:MAG TPA: SigE family RNA polymerase sigma factor [Angustibacter sp.]|nr:SigE family RNA polymerase sigma factor [Angustibacter sp.]